MHRRPRPLIPTHPHVPLTLCFASPRAGRRRPRSSSLVTPSPSAPSIPLASPSLAVSSLACHLTLCLVRSLGDGEHRASRRPQCSSSSRPFRPRARSGWRCLAAPSSSQGLLSSQKEAHLAPLSACEASRELSREACALAHAPPRPPSSALRAPVHHGRPHQRASFLRQADRAPPRRRPALSRPAPTSSPPPAR